MARRQDFTFPYTGTQIADSLERKATKLEGEIKSAHELDEVTLVAVLGVSGAKTKLEQVERELEQANVERTEQAERARKQAIPFRQAGSKEFELDLEDVQHYALNEEGVEPVELAKPKRTRRKRDPETQELVDA